MKKIKEKSKYKLVAFDLDGTVIDKVEYIWKTIHAHLDTDKTERKVYMKQYFDGKITYDEWAKQDVALWKKAGAKKLDILGALKELVLMKGARQTLLALKKRGMKLAVISGSLDIAIEKVMPDYEKVFDHILLNRLKFNKDGTIKSVIPTKYDFEHKFTGLKHICKKEKIKLSETVFVGDHENDLDIARGAGLSIAFYPHSEKLAKISDQVIRKKDLRLILKYIK